MRPNRRRWLEAAGALAATGGPWLPTVLAAEAAKPSAKAAAGAGVAHKPRVLAFPRDAGAHPEFKTEWWYITGWVGGAGDACGAGGTAVADTPAYGFQLTFFRSRVDGTQAMQSRLAARQLLFAHAAITDVKGQRLWHDQRVARWSGEAPGQNAMDTASASTTDTGVLLRDWSLLREDAREGAPLHARLKAEGFAMDLRFTVSQPLLLQGQQGLSRKGPDEKQASYYYSQPQLATTGSLRIKDQTFEVKGVAWLDHEWSQELLAPGAIGWDWIGMNLLDGSALTAFRLRDKTGQALWDGGSFRTARGDPHTFSRGEVLFKPTRLWKSPLTQTSYPVEWIVRTPADFYTVKAVIDNQELDSRQSTGSIYWEGLSELIDSNGKRVGMGYLEMTGYHTPLRM